MIILNYTKGGIGNQLFQHVFARSLARKLNADLVTDISYFDADPYGRQASVLNLQPEARTGTLAQFFGDGCYLLQDGQLQSLHDDIQLPEKARVLVLSGYWQRESLLDGEIAAETYAQLSGVAQRLVPADLAAQIEGCTNAVAVHIRRWDYAHMGLCKESYYIAVIEHLRLKYPDAELFVFTDEPNYSRHLMESRSLRFTPVASGNDLGDLYLMSLCKHFIIANSSYSWWGAFFGEGKGGKIFCPAEWVTINATLSPCPPRWKHIVGAVRPFSLDEDEVAKFFARIN